MDIERALVCKIISTGRLEDVLSRGIRSDLFYDDKCREMFDYVRSHSVRYGTPPSVPAVKADKPKFEWEYVQDPLEYLIDRFVVLAKRRLADEMVIELAKACDDPERAENIDLEFLEVSRQLAMLVPSSEVAYFKNDMERRIVEHEKLQKEGGLIGLPFGFPTLDEWTGGLQSHEFATVAGFSGLGKSTFLKRVALTNFMKDKKPLYISLEEEKRALMRKWDAQAAGLDYIAMKHLNLPDEQIENWRKTQQQFASKIGEIPVIDSIRHCTPDHVFAEAVRHKPDLIIIDYLSLMRSSRPTRNSNVWQSLTEITQDLKQVARTLKIPILAAAQTNRSGRKEGAELDNIGLSISVVQDPDIVIGLFADDEMRERKEMQIRLRKNRDGKLGEFDAIWDHERMLFREKTPNDLYTREQEEPKPAPVILKPSGPRARPIPKRKPPPKLPPKRPRPVRK